MHSIAGGRQIIRGRRSEAESPSALLVSRRTLQREQGSIVQNSGRSFEREQEILVASKQTARRRVERTAAIETRRSYAQVRQKRKTAHSRYESE